MTRTPIRRSACVLTVLVAGSLTLWSASPASGAPAKPRGEELSRRLGLQQVPKTPELARRTSGPAEPNPALALLPDPSQANQYAWQARTRALSASRKAKVHPGRKAATPLPVQEREPATVKGRNDRPADAQRIPRFGSSRGKRAAALIDGVLAAPPAATPFVPAAEDNGSIRLASSTGVRSKTRTIATAVIGDGRHGSSGDGTGDIDFYAVRGAAVGQQLVVDIDTPTSDLDSIVILWDAAGNLITGNDDDGSGSFDSLLSVTLPSAGDYFVSVTGFSTVPTDPFDSGSGTGAESEGGYDVTFGLDALDVDYYAVDLRAGDVLSGSVTGAATRLAVYDPRQVEVFGSTQDASAIYPISSPLAGGGNAVVDHVAATAGRYYVATSGGLGSYQITLEAYRPGPETKRVTQTIFLDLDGQRVNTAPFGGPGVRQLSPLSAFLGQWGIPAAQQNALVDRVVATVTENLRSDFAGTGVRVRILNSRDDADPFGRPNVSRLIVGGTVDESGVNTIGVAQSIDPGNFETAETALILLDYVSQPAGPPESFNSYLTPASNRVRFVGTALGNIASHEAGHYLGSWHVDQFDDVLNLMDQGGNFPLLYAVGPDGVGGTADDPDVDFGPDVLNPNEGFTGLENTRARTRWGLTR